MSKRLISTLNKMPCNLPDGWKWYKWGDLIVSYQQGLIRSNSELGNGNVDYLKMGDIDLKGWHQSDGLSTTLASKEEIDNYKLEYGDFLINVRNSMELVGKTCLIRNLSNTTLYNHMLVRIKHHESISNAYINAIFTTPLMNRFLSKCKSGTTTVIALYKEDLYEIPVPIPPEGQIDNITNVNENINNKIETNNKIIKELEHMAKELYNYWFVQFDFPDTNGKPYRSNGGKMTYNPTLKREIPEGWEALAIGKWIELEKGGDWGSDEESGNYSLKVSCIRGADINGVNGNGSINAPLRFINKNNTDKLLSNGDVIIEISGGSPTQSTGRAALVTDAVIERFSNPIICSNFCKALTLKDLTFRYNFIYEWQRVYDSGALFGFEGKTSGIKNFLYDAFIKSFNAATPPKYLREKFVAIIDPLNYKKHKLLNENKELATLRDWLLPMLMNGQVTVQAETEEETKTSTPIINLSQQLNQRFELWLSNQGVAARGEIDKTTLREIFDAMDEDDK